MAATVEPLAEAHRIGTFEADQLDEALRALERQDREVVAAAAQASAAAAAASAAGEASAAAAEISVAAATAPEAIADPQPELLREFAHLSAAYQQALERLHRLQEFERNVAGSRAWRILQAIRRLFGRAW